MITGRQIRAARALLGIDQKTLAEMAGLSVPTVQRMEANDGTVGGTVESMTRVIGAIETAGVEMINEGAASAGVGRGVRLRQADAGGPDQRPAEMTRGAE
jgi:transcriptional regulator with XRE-family HTH domain